MNLINPKTFVITRKRKKYKFALFSNSSLCFEFEEWDQRSADIIEVGAGTGLFSVELAAIHPDKTYVAVDVKADRLQKGAYEATTRGLNNIFFLRARANQLSECFNLHSIESIWLTFPDPFPKRRSAGRRLSHPSFLRGYRKLLQLDGKLYLKHDNHDFFCWSLEQLANEKWYIKELSFDLHESALQNGYKIMTTYETRWIDKGLPIHFVAASPSALSTS